MIARSIRVGTIACCLSLAAVAVAQAREEHGIASVYGYAGEKTANGEIARPSGLTAAHKSLPFNTRVKVTNKKNGKSVVVRINDRGPFIKGRIIDLTPSAADRIGFSGLAPVVVTVVN
ncbi:MAG: septal ring lytic transglycosylase RlpA family protein [Pseudorhodoplanes sp.]